MCVRDGGVPVVRVRSPGSRDESVLPGDGGKWKSFLLTCDSFPVKLLVQKSCDRVLLLRSCLLALASTVA